MKELNSWREQDVHKEVPNEGQHIISVRWVIKPKIIDGQHSTKARLCSGGRGGGVFNNHNVNVLNRLTNLFKRRHWNYPSYNSIP